MPQTRRWHVLSRTGGERMVTCRVVEMLGDSSAVAQVKLSPPIKKKIKESFTADASSFISIFMFTKFAF